MLSITSSFRHFEGDDFMEFQRVKIKDLQPGLILAENIFCPRFGVLLLKKETVLQANTLELLRNLDREKYCLVHRPAAIQGKEKTRQGRAFLTEDHTLHDSIARQKEVEEQLVGIPEEIADQEAKELYASVYGVINEIYKNRKVQPHLEELYSVTAHLARKILLHPEMLIQIAMLKKIDNYYLSHSVNVSIFAAYLGCLSRMELEDIKNIALAGMLHDIGKLDIPPKIFNKEGELTDEEFARVKMHSMYSFFRLSEEGSGLKKPVLEGVLQHHERFDGSGYPHGLKGSAIHTWSKILGIVDVYDALTSARTYRKAYSHHQGLEILFSNAQQFDNELLNYFIRNISFFPVGSRVQLNTGEMGTILGTYRSIPFRPIVKVHDESGEEKRIVDLSEDLTVFIEKVC